MTSRVRVVTFDCADPYTLAGFWAEMLGGAVHPDDEAGDDEVLVEVLVGAEGTTLLFQRVPEGKTVKNRVHLDLQPQDRTRDAEVERLLALEARVVGDHREPDGMGWVTMADPEGNEFCVERSAEERAAATT